MSLSSASSSLAPAPHPRQVTAKLICTCLRGYPAASQSSSRPLVDRRALLVSTTLLPALYAAGAKAAGIESVKLPFLPEASGSADAVKARLDKAADDFENSDFLKGLKERSEQNREKNKKDIQDKYCYRQAEMGVGDCAGLRLIPGMTKSGLQKEKTPERKFLEFLTGSKDEEQ